jgi:hypothetical protein
MKRFLKNIVKPIKLYFFERALKKQIKKANKLSFKYNKRALVVVYNGHPRAKTKSEFKNLIHSGVLKTDIQTIERIALYKTY